MMDNQRQATPRDEELIAAAARQIATARRSGPSADSSQPRISPAAELLARGAADALPGYHLVGERQRGGQGVVYEAFQHATRRRVAIKVLHESQVGGASRARFAREIEILAQLRHPNIVTIHDSSRAGQRLFYVMDFIDGVPFDEFAAGVRNRDPREILRVFVKICDAVQAAHLRGVMHRDLKPGNILVDAAGEPRVLDFGLAKWLDSSDVTAEPQMTATGQFLGSILWASPEQIAGAHDSLDIRCDVYSLGVILCHALTGSLPYPPPATIADAPRHIRETEPLRPSTLRAGVNDELDTIILKCLQKDPQRRYQTAGELGRDVQRYVDHDPIEAKRDSLVYLLRKRLRRHRVTVTASMAIIVACSAGLIISLLLWQGAQRQRLRAEESERIAARRADEARRVAEFQATLLNRIDPRGMGRDLLDSIRRQLAATAGQSPTTADSMLSSIDMTEVARDTLVRTLLDPAEREIESQFAGQPAIEARLRYTLTDLYRLMGRYAESEKHVRRALELRRGLPDEDLSEDLNRLGVILFEAGNFAAAEGPQREALEYAERRHGPNSAHAAVALDNLAILLEERGNLAEAEPLVRRALAIWGELHGPEHPETLTCLNNLAMLLLRRGELPEAESIAQRVLSARRASLPEDDLLIPLGLRNLARIQYGRGNLDGAETNAREALRIERGVRGGTHPTVAFSMNALAMLLMARGALDEAEALFRDALAIQERVSGAHHPDTATTLGNLGALLHKRGDYAAAAAARRRALAAWSAIGLDHPEVPRAARDLGNSLLAADAAGEAETAVRQALAWYEQRDSVASDAVARTRLLLAKVLMELDRHADAERELMGAESAATLPDLRQEIQSVLTALYKSWPRIDPAAAPTSRAARTAGRLSTDAPASEPSQTTEHAPR